MRITYNQRIANNQWRHDPETGFTRITAVLLEAGSMVYDAQQVKAPAILGKPEVRIAVPLDVLSRAESITTIEGVPITNGHVWQNSDTRALAVGAIAGRPAVTGPRLLGDMLLTDAATGRQVMNGDLCETSTGFDGAIIWEPCIDASGIPCDGRFEEILYNHVALLPEGMARGGRTMRILNAEADTMPDLFTRHRFPSGRTVRVMNEDLPVIDEEVKETETKAKNAIDPAKAAEALAALEVATAELAEKQKEVDGLKGQLQGLKDALDKAMGAEVIEAAATEMANSRTEAAGVMNSHGKKLEGDAAKLHGHPLRVHVVNSLRTEPLSDDLSKNADYVSGIYAALLGSKPSVPAGSAIGAPGAVKVENAAPVPKHPTQAAAERRARMGY